MLRYLENHTYCLNGNFKIIVEAFGNYNIFWRVFLGLKVSWKIYRLLAKRRLQYKHLLFISLKYNVSINVERLDTNLI